MRAAQASDPLTAMSVPTASVPVLAALDTCNEVRTWTTVSELNDKPRGVFAEHLLHNVTLAEITLNLSQCQLLQLRDVILAVISAPGWLLYDSSQPCRLVGRWISVMVLGFRGARRFPHELVLSVFLRTPMAQIRSRSCISNGVVPGTCHARLERVQRESKWTYVTKATSSMMTVVPI